ncbi:MAG: glycine cleavage system protein GcvH [Syntrophomonadaceae bacterium]|nr:glycine cleavage system protein GcvH [Syntrophomonadaceae bacterium]MDD3023666.1 glycine cleavage system protein GcvH [Syntrophomonadaceae bacterium]
MNIPEKLLYTSEHEWISIEGEKGRVGISDYAQHHLGDIVYVELPETGDSVAQAEALAVIESVKAVATLFSPAGGTVLEVNEELEEAPELLNEDCYANWIAVIELADRSDLEKLMDAKAYTAFCATLE